MEIKRKKTKVQKVLIYCCIIFVLVDVILFSFLLFNRKDKTENNTIPLNISDTIDETNNMDENINDEEMISLDSSLIEKTDDIENDPSSIILIESENGYAVVEEENENELPLDCLDSQ